MSVFELKVDKAWAEDAEKNPEFERGYYVYNNKTNAGSIIIQIHRTTEKTIWYSVFEIYDDNYVFTAKSISFSEDHKLIHNKISRNKSRIKLLVLGGALVYSPEMADLKHS